MVIDATTADSTPHASSHDRQAADYLDDHVHLSGLVGARVKQRLLLILTPQKCRSGQRHMGHCSV